MGFVGCFKVLQMISAQSFMGLVGCFKVSNGNYLFIEGKLENKHISLSRT
jgi:hypothetical protein